MARQRREHPWLKRHGDTYYAFWYDSGKRQTRRCSLRTRDSEEAKHRFAAFLVDGGEIYQRQHDGPVGLTAGKALDDYFSEHVEPSVVDPQRITHCITHLKKHFDCVPVAEITIPLCREYVDKRRSGEIAALSAAGEKRIPKDGTIRRELGTLVSAINHAVKWGRLRAGEKPAIERPKAPPPKELWFFHDELDRLRKAAHGRTRTFIEIAYYTAARRRSIERLTRFQVSLERNRIVFGQAGDARTKKRRPTLPIDPALRPTLERALDDSPNEFVLGGSGSIRTGFYSALRRAGLETLPAREGRPAGKPTPHTLRHTRATHLLQRGVSLWAVAGLLGDTVETVTRNYGHHCPGHLADVFSAELLK